MLFFDRGKVEVLDGDALHLNRLGLRGLLRRRGDCHILEDEAVVAERLGAFEDEDLPGFRVEQLFEALEPVGLRSAGGQQQQDRRTGP